MVTTMASVQLAHRHYHPPHHFPLVRPVSPPDQIMTLDCSQASTSHTSEGDARSISPKDLSPPPSPSHPPPSPSGSEGQDPHNSETPLRKNKRKLSEPKRRSDVIVKRVSPNTVKDGLENVVHKSNEDSEDIPNVRKSKCKKLTNGRTKKSFSWSAAQHLVGRQETLSTSSSDNEGAREHESAVPHPFLQPAFHASPSAALGFLPGLFFPGTPYPHPALHPSFSALPLHLQHTYLAAAASAQTSSTGPTSSSPPETSAAGVESSSDRAHHSKPNLNHAARHPSSSLANVMQPSASQRASSSKASASIHEDDDDASSSRAQSPEDLSPSGKLSRKHRKNYKNMTRERRVEANARERTRVHTISAAFDALRHAVPSYSHNQKLSKLAILRIACSYIMSLARLADLDYTSASEHIGTPLTFAQCVDMCTNTIQTEGRARRRH